VHKRQPRPRGRGWLNLNSVPWAKVYIDGDYRGETPIQELALPAGRHRVRLVNPSMELSSSLVVQVRPDVTVTHVVNLRHAK
jgi:serine/threonine-protein kinase